MNSTTIARPRTDPALRDSDRRYLYFFNLFRVLQACVIAGLLFSPLLTQRLRLVHEMLGQTDAIAYLLIAGYALLRTEYWRHELRFKVAILLAIDIGASTIALFALANPPSAIAMLLLVNIGAGALLLPPRQASFFAALATLCAVPVEIVDRLMSGERADPVLILARAAGFGWPTVRCVISSRPGPKPSTQMQQAAFENFERLTPATAQRVVRFWQVRQGTGE